MMIYWYFFFNDTATTEIYTLSLHDALPISNSLFARIDSLRERYNMFRQQNKYRSASALNDTLKIVEERYEQEDRKSTRLNSSHANISYAVFCLKKKIH